MTDTVPPRPPGEALVIISLTGRERIIVMEVNGEIDIDSAPVIDRDIRRACQSAPAALVIDLSGVTFCGAAGLSLLLGLHRRTRLAGTTLSLIIPPSIGGPLETTGLGQLVPTYETVNQAVAAASGDTWAPAPRSESDTPRRLRSVPAPHPAPHP